MSRELLPCPFCGASAKMMKPVESTQGQRDAGYGSRQYGVACGADLKCEAHVAGFPTSATAREAWNTRAPVSVTNDPRVVALIEAARAYAAAEEALANREYMGINAESHEKLQPRVHAARRDLDAALANLEKKE